jgi:hypothetical protein
MEFYCYLPITKHVNTYLLSFIGRSLLFLLGKLFRWRSGRPHVIGQTTSLLYTSGIQPGVREDILGDT